MVGREKEWTLISENANTELKMLFLRTIRELLNKNTLKKLVEFLCERTKSDFENADAPIELIEKTIKSIKFRFIEWYKLLASSLRRNAIKENNPALYEAYERITGEEVDGAKAKTFYESETGRKLRESKGFTLTFKKEGNEIVADSGSIEKLVEKMTTNDRGAGGQWMDNYTKVVSNIMTDIADKNLVMKDKLGRKLSIRNLAEMTARFENQREQLKNLQDKGVKYMVASSHIDASKRCEPFQALIYEMSADFDTHKKFEQKVDFNYKPKPIGKTPDGKPTYDLEDAMKHGFLGYNCRHRLIPYTEGMDLYQPFDTKKVDKQRKLEQKQRLLERQIRKNKMLSKTSKEKVQREEFNPKTGEWEKVFRKDKNGKDVPVMMNKYTLKSQKYQKKIEQLCKKNNLVRVPWRESITHDEQNLNVRYE